MLAELAPNFDCRASCEQRVQQYRDRIERTLDHYLPDAGLAPERLHQAMRYAVLGGGKRIRPLLVYMTGETLNVDARYLDAPAAAIECMHALSLVHDDLPAMDDDDLRRGRPATHRAFDEATAILAAGALQPLAFHALATDPALMQHPGAQMRLIALLADACGSNGMSAGQTLDLAAENRQLDAEEVEHMYRLKTGRLIRASVLMPAACPPAADTSMIQALGRFAECIGLAFQIRDDILDVQAETNNTGKPQGSDRSRNKATYPAILGIEHARQRADELLDTGLAALRQFGDRADGLRWLARFIVRRNT